MIPMNDFKLQYRLIKEEVDKAISDVLESGWYILGENVKSFEKELAAYCGSKFAVGVGNRLEALQLAMLACGIGNGDEVISSTCSSIFTRIRRIWPSLLAADIVLKAGKRKRTY